MAYSSKKSYFIDFSECSHDLLIKDYLKDQILQLTNLLNKCLSNKKSKQNIINNGNIYDDWKFI